MKYKVVMGGAGDYYLVYRSSPWYVALLSLEEVGKAMRVASHRAELSETPDITLAND